MNTPLSQSPSTNTLPSRSAADPLIDRLDSLGALSSDGMHRAAYEAEQWAHRSASQLRQQGAIWRDGASSQIRQHPLRSVAIAAGTGAVLSLLARWLMSSR